MYVRSFFLVGILTPVWGFSFWSVIKSILPPDDELSDVKLLSGDVSYIGYNIKRSHVRLLKSAKEKRGETLVVKGECSDYLEPYKYLLNISISIEVEILDVNDPPKFINLPSTTNVFENVSTGSTIFTIDAQNPDDVYPEFTKNKFTLLSIGSLDKPQLSLGEWFSVDNDGNVKLNHDVDYEDGPREIRIVFKVEDYGSPPRRNVSTLLVTVDDVDDLGPKFSRDVVTFAIIGEKPITVKECSVTSPKLYAEDQDAKSKAPIAYKLIHDNNNTNHWSKYFTVNEETGELCQTETVKFTLSKRGDQTVQEGPGEFNISVQAYQKDNPEKSCTATIVVTMKNVNQYKPTFKQTKYDVMIREYPEISLGSPVVTVEAEDHDYGRNGEIEYRLSVNPLDGFSVDTKTGEIKVQKPEVIDRENNSTITLKVSAVETRSHDLFVSVPEAEITIHVVDVNDNSPVFNGSDFNFTVKDNHPVGTPIHEFDKRLVADDPDEDENGDVHLTIVSVQNTLGTFSWNDFQRFRINDEGVIILQSSLQGLRREQILPEYVVVVQAQDQCLNEKRQRSNTTRVYIKVLEANDYPPVFEKKSYKVAISEAAPLGTLINEIKVTDQDGDEDMFISYNITDGNDDQTFRITEKGFLFTNKALDRELIDSYNIVVTASDGIHKVNTSISVRVKDTNDNQPVFQTSIFDFTIPENVNSGYDIGYIGASDADDGPNGQLFYTLLGEHADIFHISDDGYLSISSPSLIFDREKTEVLILQIGVEDLGQPPQKEEAVVRIYLEDVNDNAPVFTRQRYHVKIPESNLGSQYIINKPVTLDDIISIIDDDVDQENHDVVYSLHGLGHEEFNIDSTTGKLYIRNTSSIDCERRSFYNLTVTANDGQFTTSVPLILEIEDQNDNSPKFTNSMIFKINPDRPIGSLVGRLEASDDDVTEQNSHLVYLLLGGSLDKFAVDANTGEIRVIHDLTSEPYRHIYLLKIQVVDFGQPQLSDHSIATITVPINKAPVIPRQFVFRVNESFPVWSIVGQITVNDPDNGRLLYDMSVNDDTLPFYMENNDGFIRLASKLDTEVRDIYSFPVDIVNLGQPNLTFTTTVIVYIDDVNDEKPQFSSWFYTSEVHETSSASAPHTEPLKLSPDLSVTDEDAKDGDHLLYNLRGHGAEDFQIDQRTGEITTNRSADIDCERQCEYFVQIVARDENGKGLEGTAELNIKIIDENDNAPSIENDNLTFVIQPSLYVGSTLAQIKAEDADISDVNRLLTYTLIDGGDGKFFVHPSTGELTLSTSLLQEPVRQEYDMIIMVTDSGQPPLSASVMVTVYVPVNIPTTVIPVVTIAVPEDRVIDDIIFSFGDTNDTDKNITYILDSESNEFLLDEVTGDLTINATLDAEEHQLYTLVVFTIDHGEPTYTMTTTVTVNIQDINDNPPRFSTQSYQAYVSENNNPTALTTLKLVPPLDVKDPDIAADETGLTYELQGSGSEMFTIVPNTGEVYVKDGVILDCERVCDYQFEILSTDENGTGLSSAAILNVKVKDENDNVPEFLTNFTFSAKPSVPIGREIGTVQAVDMDTEPINHRLLFYLTGLGGYGKFQIEADTGTIYTTDSLLRAPVLEEYKIKVVAVDFGAPQLTAETDVTIKVPVHPTPEVPEQFDFSISENSYPGSFVGIIQLNTTDQVYFTMQHPHDKFLVDLVSGTITTRTSLDAEETGIFTIPVVITERMNRYYSVTTTVSVEVEDEDDNFPIFSSEVYTASIKEGVYDSGVELDLNPPFEVLDDDVTERNQQYEIKILDEFSDVISNVDNQALFINNFTVLDKEVNSVLHIPVYLTSAQHPDQLTEAILKITLDDINDNLPIFELPNIINVRPDATVGSILGSVNASDKDATEPNNQILYELKSGGADKIGIDSNTGELILEEPFTTEPLKSTFTLIVVARDLGYPSLTARTSVVMNVPLNQPPVVPESVEFDIEENVPLGSILSSLNITDEDSFHNLVIKITDTGVPFMLEDQKLLTTDVLNAEEQMTYQFKIVTEDGGIPSYTMTTVVNVNILDINDNVPVFTSPKYSGKIREHGTNSHVEITPAINVIDSDALSRKNDLKYSLQGDHDHQFTIDPVSGHVTAIQPTKLDCEIKCVYQMQIQVTDENGEGFQSSVPLIVSLEDINDEAPTFDFLYSVYINISTSTGKEVVQVKAVDKDREHPNNHIIYLMEDGQGKFSIDPNTGQIWLSHSLMEGGVKDRYVLTVTAIDSGTPIQSGLTDVTINIVKNSRPNVDSSYRFVIQENRYEGFYVGRVEAVDEDSELTYLINDTTVPFKIDQISGEIFTTKRIDREKVEEFQFKVFVVDNGVPRYTVTTAVTVTIEDVNDEPPRFQNGDYTVHVQENQIMEHLPLVPNITDDDATEGNRQYSFSMDDQNSEFAVNEKSGLISLKVPRMFDCEKDRSYRFDLLAIDDDGLISRQTVTLVIDDVNDEAPVVTGGFNFTVHPSAAIGENVGEIIASDFDCSEKNQRLMYSIKNGGLSKFSIDSNTGNISVIDSLVTPPYQDEYDLKVEVLDSGTPRLSTEVTVTVHVPMNKAAVIPQVEHIQMKENAIPPAIIGKISTNDSDDQEISTGQIQFLLKNDSVPFDVERMTGFISVLTELDSESVDQFQFVVEVVKQGYPILTSSCSVIVEIIDTNDNYPVFNSPDGYTGFVDEDTEFNDPTTFIQLNPPIYVSDEDATLENRDIKLRLIGSVVFDIDDTGTGLKVIKPGSLNAEDTPVYTLLLEARDKGGKGLLTTTNVTIYVKDVNDQAPIFDPIENISLSYLTPIGTKVGVVTATDPDYSEQNNKITYVMREGGHGKFDIDPDSGDVIVAGNLANEPCLDVYTLSILAIDNGFPRRSTNSSLHIKVPTNKPPRIDPIIKITVLENEFPETNVAQINIEDPDLIANKEESIEFYMDDVGAPFELDKYSGMLRTNGPIDREMVEHMTFMVRVVNDGAPRYTASSMVTVSVNDTNDNPPVFSSPTGYLALIPENFSQMTPGFSVPLNTEFSVSDDDMTEDNRNIQLKLVGKGADLFELDQESGMLKLRQPSALDCEITCRYEFKLTATDQNGHGLSTSTNLTVELIDENDHSPRFLDNYTFTISSLTTKLGYIGKVAAVDDDATIQNNQITYLYKSGGFGKFFVDSETGYRVISVTKHLVTRT
ncbi:hypothetical protein LOTGIDRAFT_229554 [Lottia gigantea]|uniref:Cadherin domain-containing protein n=1 Tax=Lottia gigantea TaxID=225164 RepID=V3ZIH1_LOTGI|nr:hypothetical protein LOTGIDRAFT_229554 [Lottia gigantea]ESO84012.1 hypothetical protein LOTGIDRAFT_229554 [Lottia gigantea]